MGTGAEMSGTKKTSVAGRLEAVVAVVGKLNVAVVTGAIQHGVVLFPPPSIDRPVCLLPWWRRKS